MLKSDVADLLVALVIITGFLVASYNYRGPVGQFPRVFLVAAFVFLLINLLIILAPDPYGTRLEVFTQGVAEEMVGDTVSELEEEGHSDEAVDDRTILSRVFMISLVFASYLLLAYFIGFVYPLPVIVFLVLWSFGDLSLLRWVGLSLLLVVLVYVIFGMIMVVPVMRGEFLFVTVDIAPNGLPFDVPLLIALADPIASITAS